MKIAHLLLALLACLPAAAAAARDLGEPPELEHTADMLPEVPDDFGFYARVDGGISFLKIGSVKTRNPLSSAWSQGQVVDASSAPAGSFGLGAGLRWSQWLRADLTVDYGFPGQVEATRSCLPCAGRLRAEADVDSLAVLANAYIDLPTFGRFTPWIGGGVGMAHLSLDSGGISLGNRQLVPIASNDAWNFAWQGSAGVAMRLTEALSLDAGYRYLGLGDIKTGGPRPGEARDIARQEVRIGLRYRLDQ